MPKTKLSYSEQLKELYEKNKDNIFNYIFLGCVLTQKIYGSVLCGKDKKELLKRSISEIIDPNNENFKDDILNGVIDLIFFIIQNKKMIKVFTKSCKCIK